MRLTFDSDNEKHAGNISIEDFELKQRLYRHFFGDESNEWKGYEVIYRLESYSGSTDTAVYKELIGRWPKNSWGGIVTCPAESVFHTR